MLLTHSQEYERESVQATTGDGDVVAAIMYVWIDKAERLSGEWSLANFETVHLANYVKECADFIVHFREDPARATHYSMTIKGRS